MIRSHSGELVAPIIVCLLASGCSQKDKIRSQIKSLEQNKQAVSASIFNRQAKLATLNAQLNVQNAGLEAYKARVMAYMMDHKMAVVALAAGGGGLSVALDKSNRFTEEAKNVGGVVAGIAVLYALAHMDEVSDVVKNLNNADAQVRVLEAEIAATQTAVQQEQAFLQREENDLNQLTRQITNLQAELGEPAANQ